MATSAGTRRPLDSWLRRSVHLWLKRGHARRRQARWPPIHEKIDDSRHLGWLHLLGVSGHIAPSGRAVADLVDQLIASETRTDESQIGSALAADALERMTVAAILVLKDEGSHKFPRCALNDNVLRNGISAPRGHHG